MAVRRFCHLLGPVFLAFAFVDAAAAATTEAEFGQKLAAAKTQAEATAVFAESGWRVDWLSAAQVEDVVSRSWWTLVQEIIEKSIRQPLAKEGSIDSAAVPDDVKKTAKLVEGAVRKAVGSGRVEADKLTSHLDPHYGKAQNVNPALQWAQQTGRVHMSIKFAQRFNAPGAVKIQNTNVTFTNTHFKLSADGEHSGVTKHYELDLELFGKIDPAQCTWNEASVGKLTVVLWKEEVGRWKRLLHQEKKVQNIQLWVDYQAKFDRPINPYDKIAHGIPL